MCTGHLDNQKNRYFSNKVNLKNTLAEGWVGIPCSGMLIGIDAYHGFKGFYWTGVGVLFLWIVVSFYRAFRSGELWFTTDDSGVTLRNGKFYSWTEVKRVDQRKVDPHTKLNWCPGYKIKFNNGDEYFIYQTLEEYTRLYFELYTRRIPGAQRPLYLFEINQSTGAKKMAGTKHNAIFYSEKNEVELKVAEPVYWW